MKNILLLNILFLSFSLTLFSQSASKTIEQLQVEVENAKDGSDKVKLLNQLAWKFAKNDSAQAFEYANKALQIADAIDSEEGKSEAYYNIGLTYYYYSFIEDAILNYNLALQVIENTDKLRWRAKILNSMALCFKEQYDYERALSNFQKSISLLEELGDYEGHAIALLNMAEIYEGQQNYTKAFEACNKALTLSTKVENAKLIAESNLSIGLIYIDTKKYDEAVDVLEKTLEMYIKLKDQDGEARTHRNLGRAYLGQGDLGLAMGSYITNLEIRQNLNNPTELAKANYDFGEVYLKLEEYDEAIRYLQNAKDLLKVVKIIQLEEKVYEQLSICYAKQEKYKEAFFYNHLYKRMSDTLRNKSNIKKIAKLEMSYKLEQQEKRNKEEMENQQMIRNFFILGFLVVLAFAFVVFRSFKTKQKDNRLLAAQKEVLLQQKEEILTTSEQLAASNTELEKLSIVASKTDNAVIIMDAKGDYQWVNDGYTRVFGYTIDDLKNEVGTNIISEQTSPTVINSVQSCIRDRKTVIYEMDTTSRDGTRLWVQTTLTPITDAEGEVTTLIAIDSDITKIKEVEEQILIQRDALKIQNQRINSSIRYARTIQKAILPIDIRDKNYFDAFVMYLPKDIVSGDFYWHSKIVKEDGSEMIFIAAVDCTGHGVPGAFMSMIGSRLLNEIVNEKRILSPAKILDSLNDGVHASLKQEQSDNNDGMDLALCRIEKGQAGEYKVVFSGAECPLIYHEKEKGCSKVDGDPKSIGGILSFRDTTPFSNIEKIFKSGDSIYLSSDGLMDQNNSERSRFSAKRLMQIVEDNSEIAMEKQGEILQDELKQFQGNEEQRDDITVIGIRFV